MRVLLLTHEFPPGVGGVGTYAFELANAGRELGHEIDVFAPAYDWCGASRFDAQTSFRTVRFRGSVYSARGFPRLVLTTLKALRSDQYDIVHTADWSFTMSMALLGRVFPQPFVCTVHGTEMLTLPRSKHLVLLGLSDLYAIPQRVFTNSEFTKRLLLETWPAVASERVTVTGLGVSDWWFEVVPEEERSTLRRKLGIAEDGAVVCTIARVIERKGHLVTLAAIAGLPETLKRRLAYVIAGPCSADGYLQKIRAAGRDAAVQVIFAEALTRSEIRALLAMSSVFCMPGVPARDGVEGFGLAYLEASAQGVPCLASKLGGAVEAVVHGVNGLVVTPGSADELREAMVSILGEPARRAAMSRSAIAHARRQSWRQVAKLTYGESAAARSSGERSG